MAKKQSKKDTKIKVRVIAPYGFSVGDKEREFGEVYSASQKEANKLFAMKLITPQEV